MTALAFLFAVFLARPCPFYILDEVEAALDDLNLDRFLALLRRYSDRAQFIVITHQKRTMEAADWLYGVSMGGDGVSKVLSRRLPAEAVALGRRRTARSVAEIVAIAGGLRACARSVVVMHRPLLSSRGPWRATGAICSSPTRARARGGVGRVRGVPARAVPAPAREHGEDPRGARRRDPGDAVRHARRAHLGTAGGGADHGRRRRAHDRRRSCGRSRPRRGAGELEGGEALSERLIELLAETARVGDGAHRHAPAADRDHGGRRQRDRQDDDDRQARVAPAPRAADRSVLLGAADTFRAAASEQLEGWAQRAGVRDRDRRRGLGSGRGRVRGDRAGAQPRAWTS